MFPLAMTTKKNNNLAVFVDLLDERNCFHGCARFCHLVANLSGWDGKEILSAWQWDGEALQALVWELQGDTEHAARDKWPLYSNLRSGAMQLGSVRMHCPTLHLDQVKIVLRKMEAIQRQLDRQYREWGPPADDTWALVRYVIATGARHALFRGREHESTYVAIPIAQTADIAMRTRWLVHDWMTKHDDQIQRETVSLGLANREQATA